MPRKARPWFRFYVEAVHDRKLRRLKPEVRWLFVACLAAARSSCAPGWLLVGVDDPMGHDDLADFAGVTVAATRTGTALLIEAGVLGWDEPSDAWFIPAWSARQYESDDVTPRVQKHRAKERSNTVTETPDVTPPETETDTEPSLVPSRVTTPVPLIPRSREAIAQSKELAPFLREKFDRVVATHSEHYPLGAKACPTAQVTSRDASAYPASLLRQPQAKGQGAKGTGTS